MNSVKTCRIHLMGASGAGVTSLGRALADALAVSHHDTDDYFWRPTTPPYREIREVADRLRLMREVFLDRADWVLSGDLQGWGDPSFRSLIWWFFCARRLRFACSACAIARLGTSAPMQLLLAAGGTTRQKNSLSGHPTTTTEVARGAI